MEQFKFANILLENNPRSISYPSMYCRSDAPVVFNHEYNVWEMYGPGTFDFTTYFNALSIKKFMKYTAAKAFHLHLELRGAACTVRQTYADTYAKESIPLKGTGCKLARSKKWQVIDIDICDVKDAILVGFQIKAKGPVHIRNSYYYADMKKSSINKVNLVLATTTFKKEDFVERNIKLVRQEIMKGHPEIAKHFRMLVIDNGRTLDAKKLSGRGITVLPNKNAGGAGGFARGMIEAQRTDIKATHVLLMDDDVAVSAESLKRTFRLLQMLKPEFNDAMISGAMLNYEVGEDQWEDIGYMTPKGRFSSCKPPLRVSLLHDIVMNEQFVPSAEQAGNMYAAWWYCAIPISVIRENGYPLPVFVRCDDAEYGIRCNKELITLNGICIWHMSFHTRYSAAVERYQTTRNTLIAQATTGMAKDADFLYELHSNLQIELKKFNYTDAALLLDGFEDFLKGPKFISQYVAEDCFMRANKNAEKLMSFDELRELTRDIEEFNLDDVDPISLYRDDTRTTAQRIVDFVTFNRQRVYKGTSKGIAVIPSEGWIYPSGKIRGKDCIIAIDPNKRRGTVRFRDIEKFDATMKRYHNALNYYKKNKKRLEAEYAAARDWLTSKAFWMQYLEID